MFARVGAWCVERPAPVIALAVLLAIVGAIGAASLKPDGEAETLVDKGSETFAATEEFKAEFGDDAVVILVQGDLEQLVSTQDLGKLLLLEGCVVGQRADGRTRRRRSDARGLQRPRRVETGAGGLRAGDVPEPVRPAGDRPPATADRSDAAAAADAAAVAAYKQRPSTGAARVRGQGRGRSGEAVGPRRVHRERSAPRRALRPERRALARRPELRQLGRVRLALRGRHAEGQVLVPLPVEATRR